MERFTDTHTHTETLFLNPSDFVLDYPHFPFLQNAILLISHFPQCNQFCLKHASYIATPPPSLPPLTRGLCFLVVLTMSHFSIRLAILVLCDHDSSVVGGCCHDNASLLVCACLVLNTEAEISWHVDNAMCEAGKMVWGYIMNLCVFWKH